MSEIERPTPKSARMDAGYGREPREMIDATARAVSRLPGWNLVNSEDNVLRAVRMTRLLRFKDDITVRAYPGARPDHSRLEIHSASRLGKSDLGQNPRNLQELAGALEKELG